MGMESLAHEQFAARPPQKRIDVLMVVASAKAAQHSAPLIRFPITIIVFKQEQFGAMPDVATVFDEFEASGNHQAVGEHRGFVCATIVIGVLENQDFVIRLVAWLNLRIDRAANDPESAARIEANLNWLHH